MKKALVVIAVLVFNCKPSSPPHEAIGTIAALEAAHETMLAGTCTLVTVSDDGMPYARVMDPLDPDEKFEVWLATNPRTRKIEHLKQNPNVVLHYIDQVDNGYVSLYGKAELVRDSIAINKHWKPEWDQFYPNRYSDCVLIKIKPTHLEVINYRARITGDPLTWQPMVITF